MKKIDCGLNITSDASEKSLLRYTHINYYIHFKPLSMSAQCNPNIKYTQLYIKKNDENMSDHNERGYKMD